MKTRNKADYFNLTGYLFIILLFLTIAGFFKTYFGIFPDFKATIDNAMAIHIHAFAATIWVLLLVVQPLLIRYKKYKLHLLLGKFTYILAPILLITFISLMYIKYQEPEIKEYGFFYIIHLGDIPFWYGLYMFYFIIIHTIFFATFYTLAIINRKNIARHSGYMIATGLVFLNPALRRFGQHILDLPFTTITPMVYVIIDLILVALIFYAKSKNLNYKLYVIVLLLYLFLYHIPSILMLFYLPFN